MAIKDLYLKRRDLWLSGTTVVRFPAGIEAFLAGPVPKTPRSMAVRYDGCPFSGEERDIFSRICT